ncbi:MAG TPA: hypothetical protein VEN29_13345, partial [Casimicrobiaceae bacterium]|nr:hypothetical protein [Casimicrobiaceae bacterium]
RSMRCACALVVMVVAACAAPPPTGPTPAATPGPAPSGAQPPAPEPPKPQAPPTTSSNPPANVNLQGFPLSYRQGYADGCASIGAVEHKDAARFKNDGQYRTGWQDGFALCKKR